MSMNGERHASQKLVSSGFGVWIYLVEVHVSVGNVLSSMWIALSDAKAKA